VDTIHKDQISESGAKAMSREYWRILVSKCRILKIGISLSERKRTWREETAAKQTMELVYHEFLGLLKFSCGPERVYV
jgi:hypothetical protein